MHTHTLFRADAGRVHDPVECFGMTFPDNDARREHFAAILREKLKDPEFRTIEGFPHGSDEDILALSDPPYYTACPNPFLVDFIRHYGKPYDPDEAYSREPFAADVSEGKNDPIYNAHSYHTKVPHKAVMRYILHYTEPGDVVFDGFCGTGMTGVAAQMCGDRAVIESLGYRVDKDGTILQQETDENGKAIWKPFSKLGSRRAVLNDLSPIATFVAYNYNTPLDADIFMREASSILKEVEKECGWMYETLHADGRSKGKIHCTVWSDVFVCPECMSDITFWESAIDREAGDIQENFSCPHCSVVLSKRNMERSWITKYDSAINKAIRQAKQAPVLIVYVVDGKRFQKQPDRDDLALIGKIENCKLPYWFPCKRMMDGKESRRNDSSGVTHTHHFYTRRNLYALSMFLDLIKHSHAYHPLQYQLDSLCIRQSRLTRFLASYYFHGGGGWVGTPLSGTLYIPSFSVEVQPFDTWENRSAKTLARVEKSKHSYICTTQDAGRIFIDDSCIDYLFLDPPFGSNIAYSELSYLWESWLKVSTNTKAEAIENRTQNKGPNEYRHLMTRCFKEAYRVLKPGRWMTVEFSNTRASVWNSIQTALMEAGFIVANVSALDKKQGSFKAVTTPTAVKQDLVISAYKPDGGFEARFIHEAQTEEGIWDFVRTHLQYLPVAKRGAARLIAVAERDPRILYDQMVAYYVRKGYPVPLNSAAFQEGLFQRFSCRDGMYFLPEQAAEYDKKKLAAGGMELIALFISDESSAIAWLRQLLKDKPLSFQDIHPLFLKELGGWQKHEKALELSELLSQNFLRYDGKGEVPSQIHSYLSTNFKKLRNLLKDDENLRIKARDRWYVPDPNKAEDLERLRERSLLKEFEDYSSSSRKRLNVFRLEAVRAGFKRAWQERDYAVIITVAHKIPESVLQKDPKLLMWYDQALTRSGEG
jgi:DNA modification methylase